MRKLRSWSLMLGTLAFAALPLLASGCAENQSDAPPVVPTTTDDGTMDDDLNDLDEELGDPLESGSDLGLPESGSSLE